MKPPLPLTTPCGSDYMFWDININPKIGCPTRKGSNIFVNYSLPPVVRATPPTRGLRQIGPLRGPSPHPHSYPTCPIEVP